MNNRMRRWTILVIAAVGIFVLIFDAQTALHGAHKGIEICIYTIIPTLFPYIFLSGLISSLLLGRRIPGLRCIGRVCNIPDGAESLLLLGLIGGYPVGAQLIADSYRTGQLDRQNAHRMLGFCSNAGPSFLFGMLSAAFTNPNVPLVLWVIHILSALLTGVLLPGRQVSLRQHIKPAALMPLPVILERSLKTVARICGWVILFRMLITICEQWFLHHLPAAVQTVLVGLLELSNGCIALQDVQSECMRMILSTLILAFGGLCVGMQTVSVTKSLGSGMYFPGKILQSFISFLLILPETYMLYPHECGNIAVFMTAAGSIAAIGVLLFIVFRKKLWHSVEK